MGGYYGLLVNKTTFLRPTMPLDAIRHNVLEPTHTIATLASPRPDRGATTTHVGSCR